MNILSLFNKFVFSGNLCNKKKTYLKVIILSGKFIKKLYMGLKQMTELIINPFPITLEVISSVDTIDR